MANKNALTIFSRGLLALSVMSALSGCASGVASITETLNFYPSNSAAEKLGAFTHYHQYASGHPPEQLSIRLPNGEIVRGHMTFLEASSTQTTAIDPWGESYFGFNAVGPRHRYPGHSVYWHSGFYATPRVQTVRDNNQQVKLDAVGEQSRLNCEGEYNRQQKVGTLQCQLSTDNLSNEMTYKVHLRRIAVRQ
ncbi:hypothetical protein [Ostreibacterium oceani]|uniref:Lipoprotein n=1 Tax=Ostreibacterium oceani TaxID=2654998 RepID=A0A6N7EWB7_9GAMM|nr:hypothetical protein [Ostreibacterium oceani]MPV86841.1 hypothetical protein [Ostreibacterium oceani]